MAATAVSLKSPNVWLQTFRYPPENPTGKITMGVWFRGPEIRTLFHKRLPNGRYEKIPSHEIPPQNVVICAGPSRDMRSSKRKSVINEQIAVVDEIYWKRRRMEVVVGQDGVPTKVTISAKIPYPM